MSVGILGLGVHLPQQVRTNDWWSNDVVGRWWQRPDGKLDRPRTDADETSAGAKLVLQMMAEYRDDPFKGARRRHVMADHETTTAMEIEAARSALDDAQVRPEQIDLVLAQTTMPDYLLMPNGCRVHEALGLPRRCLTLQAEGMCTAFLVQLHLAHQMIQSGAAQRALLIQSSGTTRFMRPEDPMSAWVGDGATAVVVGRVADGYGIRSAANHTDGRYFGALVGGTPGQPWWQGGAPQAYLANPERSRQMLLRTVDDSRGVLLEALSRADLQPHHVDFFASHQGFAWLRRVTQSYAGLDNARSHDTFADYGSLLGANIPLVMWSARKLGTLREGDLVAAFAGASGATLAASVFRWGGR